ncbi:lysophospholipid acyltransferase family protein [Bacillus litorisediminis]|uniref:glycerol acyltransferase n=1 Tax=Bacillus litorisediminis TaxID=2922713 RepID=UPI001FACF80A|nr:glycerol acyltransferase [Bacillus litorisediminis]
MNSHFYGKLFRFVRFVTRTVYPKYKIILSGTPAGPAVYVSHHQNFYGPFVTYLWLPIPVRVWVLHVFFDKTSCYRQFVDYTFTVRLKMKKKFAAFIAFLLSSLISKFFQSANAIPVFRGTKKIVDTFNDSVQTLKRGEPILIFPDIEYANSSSVMQGMYEGFLYLERYFHRETGNHIHFIPLYVSKKTHTVITGEPISFRDGEPFKSELKIVSQKLRDSINQLAQKCGDV